MDGPAFVGALLGWYAERKRDLPWRRTRDPYAVWISEIMLQQTQVASVVPYYERFLDAFPDVEALAGAPLERVLKLWEGLGYYSRARNLHSAAREVRGKYGGRIPPDFDALLSLPGVGDYTAAAIASIAFGKPEPVIDGNVWRVMARVMTLSDPLSAGRKKALRVLQEIIPRSNPSDFNQAMMELGATVCTPRNPSCSICPVRFCCRAIAENRVGELPVRPARKALPHEDWAVLVLAWRGRVLLRRRPLTGLWGGLWEFPSTAIGRGGDPRGIARGIARSVRARPRRMRALQPVAHTFSHFKVTLHPFRADLKERIAPPDPSFAWVSLERLECPMPSPHLKIAARAVQDSSDGEPSKPELLQGRKREVIAEIAES